MNPRKEHTSVTFCGGSQSAMPLVLAGSICTVPFLRITPKNSILHCLKVHFSGLR